MISKQGFSLIETLIALAILAIASFSSLKFYNYLEIERANSGLWLKAMLVAKSQISLIQRVNSTAICNGHSASFDLIEQCKLEMETTSPFIININVEKTLSHFDSSGNNIVFAKILLIEVSWNDRKERTQSLSLPTTVSLFTNLFE